MADKKILAFTPTAAIPLVIVNGAPGIGKSTLCRLLGDYFNSPVIDFGRLRELHLDPLWERASDQEEAMSFGLLKVVIDYYLSQRFDWIFLNDLRPHRVEELLHHYRDKAPTLLSLVTLEKDLLSQRIINRNKGWRDVDGAWDRNQDILEKPRMHNEMRIDVAEKLPEELLTEAVDALTAFATRK